jgi:hypothetical protein
MDIKIVEKIAPSLNQNVDCQKPTCPCSRCFLPGWCSKILENVDKSFKEDADFGIATQRDCLQRPPSDGQVRHLAVCPDGIFPNKNSKVG